MKRVNTYWSSDATLHEPRREAPRQPTPLSHWTPLWFAVALFTLAILVYVFGVGCAATPVSRPLTGLRPPVTLTRADCEAVAQASLKAASANDTGTSTLLLMLARKGGCW